jgi:hypothetical protein
MKRPSPRRAPAPPSKGAERAVKLKLPSSRGDAGLSRRVLGELDFVRSAWSAAGSIARRQFLAELLPAICRVEPQQQRATKVPDGYGSALDSFLKRHVVPSPGDRVQSSALYAHYRRTCLAAKSDPLTHTRFSRLLKERGYKKLHSNIVYWVGIKLADGRS